jgi:hypothetical protein
VLAIIETLLAIALVFYLSMHFNTLRWLAVAMCVSPLLLLRTEKSTRLTIEWFDRWDDWQDRVSDRRDDYAVLARKTGGMKRLLLMIVTPLAWSFWTLIGGALITVGVPAVRIGATVASSLHEPWVALQAIPKNWSRVTLAMDSFFPPEMIPDHTRYTLRYLMVEHIEGSTGMSRWFLASVGRAVVFTSLFFPALFYRWSLKATSIIYAPLVFVARSTFSEGANLRTKLELIKRGDLSRIRALYGVAAIVAFLVKLVLMMKWSGFVEVWKGNPITEFLSLYIAPAEIPKWQLAELANSVLAVGAMLFARQALLRYELNHPLPEKPVKRILGFVSGVRWVLALYAIVCLGYITMREAHNWHWPALGTKWLPFW